VPVLLGSGECLFDGNPDDLRGLELARTVAARKVVHLKFQTLKRSPRGGALAGTS
jgi:hypothetical protein